MSWRRLSSSSSEDFFKTSSRRLDQDKYVRFTLASSEDIFIFKTFWSRPIYSSWPYVFKMSSRCFESVFKTSSRRLENCLQDISKTFSRRFEFVFKTSFKDIFKTYHQVKLFLLTRLWEAFNTFLRRSFPKTIIYRGICPGNTTSNKFMVSVQNLHER